MIVTPPGTVELGPAAPAGIRRAFIEASIIRADGTVEHLGVIADSHFDADGNAAPANKGDHDNGA